jgi:hypothetical protein
MPRFQRWNDTHRDDSRALMPRCQEVLAAHRDFLDAYGKRAADTMLTAANEAREANTRRARAVLVGLESIRERIENDPSYSAKQTARDADVLRSEFQRLQGDLPRP